MSNEISEKPKITFEDEMAFAGYVHEGDKDKVMEYLRNPNYGLTNEERVGNRGLFRL